MGNYTVEKLSFAYPNSNRRALENINLEIKSGEFVLIIGPSGSGKTTFLKNLKPSLTPYGLKEGKVRLNGEDLEEIDLKSDTEIGYLFQSPDDQIVTDKVWHELAFGLESLGQKTEDIRLRVSEIASYFGLQTVFDKETHNLSGGQKQLLNLASIMVMDPSVIILDEPTSQLDPLIAKDFLAAVKNINEEFGKTIIMTEHRLEEVIPLVDRIIVLKDGKVSLDGKPRDIVEKISRDKGEMFLSLGAASQLYGLVESIDYCPINIREARDILIEKEYPTFENLNNKKEANKINDFVLEIDEPWFRYERKSQDIVRGPKLSIKRGEIFALLGGNGTGKSTLLSLISQINIPYRGKILINGKDIGQIDNLNELIGLMPQKPELLFAKKQVELELRDSLEHRNNRLDKLDKEIKLKEVIYICQLETLLNQHPYDLSGGERQRLALAKILLSEPEIILLDEPTKGLDGEYKSLFGNILKELSKSGKTIFLVSHDIEFCAEYSDRTGLFFNGNLISSGKSRDFFMGNSFYTTATNRMTRKIVENCVVIDDLTKIMGGKSKPQIKIEKEKLEKILSKSDIEEKILKKEKIEKENLAKIALSLISIFVGINMLKPFLDKLNLYDFRSLQNFKEIFHDGILRYILAIILIDIGILNIVNSLFKLDRLEEDTIQMPINKRRLSKRTRLSIFLSFILIPLTLFIGSFYLAGRKYYFISLLIMIYVSVPFLMVFEDRNPEPRELVLIASLAALTVAGRAAFFMLPQFKPVAALVIISGIALGGESGFFVGALSMFLSNMLYGQGPWTPWQMFAMGLIGLISGIAFKKGLLRRDKKSMAVFGGVIVFLLYGGIMNPASVIMFQTEINKQMILAAYLSGIPFDLIHAIATAFFIMIIGEPMLEKIDRIKEKYGILKD